MSAKWLVLLKGLQVVGLMLVAQAMPHLWPSTTPVAVGLGFIAGVMWERI